MQSKRESVYKQALELAEALFKDEPLDEAEALFKRLFKENDLMYSSSHLKAFFEGMIFASGTPFPNNMQSMALILAIISKYNKKKDEQINY